MSKIGRANLEAQEYVETLGYSTVGEAIADGWDSNEFFATRELENAYSAWLKEKEDLLEKLRALLIKCRKDHSLNTEQCETLASAIAFIDKGAF